MSNKKSGGMAFPCVAETGVNYPDPGMTLRDYFAAKAMQSIILATAEDAAKRGKDPKSWATTVVESSFSVADAMLKERNK